MVMPRDPVLSILLTVRASNPALLEGLEHLYGLGLISDSSLRRLAQEQLNCVLPTPTQVLEPVLAQAAGADTGAIAAAKPFEDTQRSRRGQTSPTGPRHRWLQAFLDEISVLWLLFLGLFLVVVSSAVLAASQWQAVSPVGQYLILLAYSLAFWGAGAWARRDARLRLTATMLERLTLLLVPINFWAMDGFGLWRLPWGWMIAGGAAIALSFLLKQTLSPLLRGRPQAPRWLLNGLALSWLHWGWDLPLMPLIASYLAVVGTAYNLISTEPWISAGVETSGPPGTPAAAVGDRDPDASQPSATSPPTTRPSHWAGNDSARDDSAGDNPTGDQSLAIALVLLSGALLLVARAVLIVGLPVSQLGLALGLGGAALVWRDRRPSPSPTPFDRPWSWGGGLILTLGWLVSMTSEPPWQALVVSALALILIQERLGRLQSPAALTAFFGVGLQALGLAGRLVPAAQRAAMVEQISAIAGSNGMPFALVGVAVFPYLLLFVVWGDRFHRRRQTPLARQALLLATVLGSGLTLLSWGNPLMRALNLSLSVATLAWQARHWGLGRDPVPVLSQSESQNQSRATSSPHGAWGWIALLQLLIWGAIFSWARVIQPDLSLLGWSLLGLVGAALEWGWSLGRAPLSWRRSAWLSGALLAGVSYGCGALNRLLSQFSGGSVSPADFLWWLVPLGLVAMADHPRCLSPQVTRLGSLAATFLIQPWGWMAEGTTLAGLGLATLITGYHSRQWQRLPVVAIAVGWSTIFVAGLARLLLKGAIAAPWLVIWGMVIALLWLSWALLRPRRQRLAQLYGRASNGWASVLAMPLVLWLLGMLTAEGLRLGTWIGPDSIGPDSNNLVSPAIWAAALPSLALAFGLWRSRQDAAALGLGLFGGLTLGALLTHFQVSAHPSAFTFLAVAWALLLLGELWLARQPETRPSEPQVLPPSTEAIARPLALSCHSLPLVYAGVGLVLGHAGGGYSLVWEQGTGLITILAASLGLGVGRRHVTLQAFSYLGLLAASFGCFELLLYQLSRASGGHAGDGVVLMGGLSLGLAWGLHLSTPLLRQTLRLATRGIEAIATLHWALGSLLAGLALLMPLGDRAGLLWMGLVAIAGLFALAQSHRTSQPLWHDMALVQLLSALGYGIHLWLAWPTLLGWAAAIACPVAILLEITPWHRWGWTSRAGQRWATLLPGVVTLLTAWDIHIQALLIVAVFYGGLAQRRGQVRLGYVSLFFLDWALLRIFAQLQLRELLWYGILGSANLLYWAQVDPSFKSPSARHLRHTLRSLGAATVCLSGFYQAEVGMAGISDFGAGLWAIALCFGFIAAGLILRIRAFLYVGTVAFVLRVLLQVWRFIQDDSLFLWGIGIVLGLLLIWIAATFETRRSQLSQWLDQWLNDFESWA